MGAQTITDRDLQRALDVRRAGGNAIDSDRRSLLDALVARALLMEAARGMRGSGLLGAEDSISANEPSASRARQEERLLDRIYEVQVSNRVPGPDSVLVREEWIRRSAKRPFSEPSPSEVTNLRGELLESAREVRFKAFMDSLASAVAIQVHYDRLGPDRWDRKLPFAASILFSVLLICGVLLRYSPRSARLERMRPRHSGGIAIQVALVGLLLLMGARYLVRPGGGGGDFFVYHHAAQQIRAGISPYVSEGAKPESPYLYAPVTLWIFRPFTGLVPKKAFMVWLLIKIAMAAALGVIYLRFLSGRIPMPLLVAAMLFAFHGAELLDLRVGNIAIVEALLLWSAFLALLHDRRWLSAVLIAMSAQFKLLPIVFLSLLLWPTRNHRPRFGPFILGVALFGLLLALPSITGMRWAEGYLHSFDPVRPAGEVNPSMMGLVDMLSRGAVDGSNSPVAPWVWAISCVLLSIASFDWLRSAWRGESLMERICGSVMLFILLSPRPMVYGYSLAIVPALWLVAQRWPRPIGMTLAVAVLTAQGLILRGVLLADYLPGSLPWPTMVVIANSPFILALALWLQHACTPRAELVR